MKSSNSYSAKEAHIKGMCIALGNSVLGGSTHDSRAHKTPDGYNASLKYVVESINHHGYQGQKGLLLSDCDLTAHDMNYLSATMAGHNYNFTVVDLSDNPQLGALGVDYLVKGADGISHLQLAQTASINHAQGKPMMLMGKPFELPPEMLAQCMQMAQTINPDDYTFKGLLTRSNFNFQKLDLSGCNIGDSGADILGHALAKGRIPSLKNIDLSGNGINPAKIKHFLDQFSQDIFVVTEKSYEEGKAVYKDTSGKLYDMHIKSDGKDAIVEFADGITGISGVSAGDTCPAPVKDQIIGCIKGGLTATAGAAVGCMASSGAYPVCVANAAIVGCGVSLVGVGISPCVDNAYNSIENYFKGGSDNDKGFGFSATGGTEIKGTTIDNDHGLVGSNFDLSQHDF